MSTTTTRPDSVGTRGHDHPDAGTDTGQDIQDVEDIEQLRARINEIDETLIALWRERADISRQAGAARVAAGGTRLALSREREILDYFHRELGPIGTQLALLLLRAGRGPL